MKIEAADKDMTGKFSVYVVEVWGESKRLAVTHRRYGQTHARNSPSTRRRCSRCLGPFVPCSCPCSWPSFWFSSAGLSVSPSA